MEIYVVFPLFNDSDPLLVTTSWARVASVLDKESWQVGNIEIWADDEKQSARLKRIWYPAIREKLDKIVKETLDI